MRVFDMTIGIWFEDRFVPATGRDTASGRSLFNQVFKYTLLSISCKQDDVLKGNKKQAEKAVEVCYVHGHNIPAFWRLPWVGSRVMGPACG